MPKANILDSPKEIAAMLARLTQPEPYLRRLNRLRIDRQWLDLLEAGAQVHVQFDDWVNKSLSRYQITISSEDVQEAWPTLYTPGVGVQAMLAHFFPWADVAVDMDAHEESARNDWMTECYGWKDSDTGEVCYIMPFEEWYKPPEGIWPVSENGETATYSLYLSINDFGRAFLLLDDYLGNPDAPESIGFTFD